MFPRTDHIKVANEKFDLLTEKEVGQLSRDAAQLGMELAMKEGDDPTEFIGRGTNREGVLLMSMFEVVI